MKETVAKTVVALELINPETGETTHVKGESVKSSKYYSIKNITTRINNMDLLTVMELTCKSSKDIRLFNNITESVDSTGRIRFDSIKATAEKFEVSREKLTRFLKLLTENNFTVKLDKGVYMVNPFIFIGKRIRSNADRETLQAEWNEL
jgi:hypothetical protein